MKMSTSIKKAFAIVVVMLPMTNLVGASPITTTDSSPSSTTTSVDTTSYSVLTSLNPFQTFITLPLPIPDWVKTIKDFNPSTGEWTGDASLLGITATTETAATATTKPSGNEGVFPSNGTVSTSSTTTLGLNITGTTTTPCTTTGSDAGHVDKRVVEVYTTITLSSPALSVNSSVYTPTANVQVPKTTLWASNFVEPPVETLPGFTTIILPSGKQLIPLSNTNTSLSQGSEIPTPTVTNGSYQANGTALSTGDFSSAAISGKFNLAHAALEPVIVLLMISTVAMAVRLAIFIEG